MVVPGREEGGGGGRGRGEEDTRSYVVWRGEVGRVGVCGGGGGKGRETQGRGVPPLFHAVDETRKIPDTLLVNGHYDRDDDKKEIQPGTVIEFYVAGPKLSLNARASPKGSAGPPRLSADVTPPQKTLKGENALQVSLTLKQKGWKGRGNAGR